MRFLFTAISVLGLSVGAEVLFSGFSSMVLLLQPSTGPLMLSMFVGVVFEVPPPLMVVVCLMALKEVMEVEGGVSGLSVSCSSTSSLGGGMVISNEESPSMIAANYDNRHWHVNQQTQKFPTFWIIS